MAKPELSPEQLIKLRRSAEAVLARGWYLFGIPHGSKAPFAHSRGHLDAKRDASSLKRWDNDPTANPAINLVSSNLTVLDIDRGLVDLEHARKWAKQVGIDNTLMVVSGRSPFGIHFYFTGTVPKNTDYHQGNISGDIKCNGYVLAPGALHRSGAEYVIINDVPPAPLPEWIASYQLGVAEQKKQERADKLSAKKAAVVPLRDSSQLITNADLQYGEEYPNQKVHAGKRHQFLRRKAWWFRTQGMGAAAIVLALRDICIERCVDGEQYFKEKEESLMSMAQKACEIPVPKATCKKGPRPRPGIEIRLDEALPPGVTRDKREVYQELVEESWFDPREASGRMALSRALASLGIVAWRDRSGSFYTRRAVNQPAAALQSDRSVSA
jgi:hypothetical protein